MKILSITAQKPHSTGSGVYLTELVKQWSRQGHAQAVAAGVYPSDAVNFPPDTAFYPVYFDTPELPFPIAGMSDEMPYPSTRYRDLTPERTERFGPPSAGRWPGRWRSLPPTSSSVTTCIC